MAACVFRNVAATAEKKLGGVWRHRLLVGWAGCRSVLRGRGFRSLVECRQLHLEQAVGGLEVEVALVTGFERFGDINARPQHRLPCLRDRTRFEVGRRDALLAENGDGDEAHLFQPVAAESVTRPCRHRLVLGDASLPRVGGDRCVRQSSLSVPVEDRSVEVLHEAGELVVGQHRRRAQGREQALRGEVYPTGSRLGSTKVGGREAAHQFLQAQPGSERVRHAAPKMEDSSPEDDVGDGPHSAPSPPGRAACVAAEWCNRLTPQGTCARS